MATNTSKYSLAEQAKRLDPDGAQAMVAEVLAREIPIFYDAPWMAANDIWVNKTVRRGSLPSGTWRKLNKGVSTEVSRVTEVLDTIGMLETYAEYDKEYIDNMPNPASGRITEAQAFIEGMSQTMGSALLYSDAGKDPDQIHGFAPRMSSVDNQYVQNSGGSGSDVTSIYVITWDRDACYLVYPKNNGELGIRHTDMGEVTLTDATTTTPSTSQYQGYRDHFQVKCGLVVRDLRKIGRVANIETAGTSNTFDEDLLIKTLNRMKTNDNTRIYVNDTLLSQMQIAANNKNNINYTPGGGEGLAGEVPVSFQGIPIRKIDRDILLNTESAIS